MAWSSADEGHHLLPEAERTLLRTPLQYAFRARKHNRRFGWDGLRVSSCPKREEYREAELANTANKPGRCGHLDQIRRFSSCTTIPNARPPARSFTTVGLPLQTPITATAEKAAR